MQDARLQPVYSALRAALTAAVAISALAGCGHAALFAAPANPAGFEAAGKKAQPAQAAGTYYKGVSALKGRPLLNGLRSLVTKGHKELEYDVARDHMFATLYDPDGKNVVQDVYTGRRVQGVTDRKTAFHRGLNAEHCWPQSMGAKGGPAKSDLHHLFPADAGANSQRGNMPLGVVVRNALMLPDFLGDGLHSRVGEATTGTQVFEPRADHQGDAARAMLYFYVRYGGGAKANGDVSLANFKQEIDTMLKWHAADPVSAAEKVRNEAIFKLQGNRNPFVDRPDFVKGIGSFLPVGGKEATELPAD